MSPVVGPHNNLFGLLRLGKATRAFRSGGEETRGAHSGARASACAVQSCAYLLAGWKLAVMLPAHLLQDVPWPISGPSVD